MSNVELTKAWVNGVLDKLNMDDELSYHQLNLFYDALVELFKQKVINKDTITVSEFLVACLGYFILHDLKQQKSSPAVNLDERRRRTGYHRNLNYMDIEESKKRFNTLFNELSLKHSTKCSLEEKKPLFSWLELIYNLQKVENFDRYIQRYRWDYVVTETTECDQIKTITTEQQVGSGSVNLFPKKFIEYILYDHYALDPKTAEEGLPLVNRYSAIEAAKKLGLSLKNLIKSCLEGKFGAYLEIGTFEIFRTTSSSIDRAVVDEVRDVAYPYQYKGFVRLCKTGEHSLQAFYQGSKIGLKRESKRYLLIRLQASLAQAIQGKNEFIQLFANQQITIDDLIFIENEILENQKQSAILSSEQPFPLVTSKIPQTFRISNKELTFQCYGEYFYIVFNNKTLLANTIDGLVYIAHLLKTPNQDVPVLDLYRLIHKSPISETELMQLSKENESLILNDAFFQEQVIDDQAKKEFEDEVKKIGLQLKTLDSNSEKYKHLESTKEKIENYLKASTYKGDVRKMVNSIEKIRKTVSKAIHNAFKSIGKEIPELSAYFNEHIRTERFCWRYFHTDF